LGQMVSGFGCQVTRPSPLLLQRPRHLPLLFHPDKQPLKLCCSVAFFVGFDRYSPPDRPSAMEFLDPLELVELVKFLELSLLALLEVSELLKLLKPVQRLWQRPSESIRLKGESPRAGSVHVPGECYCRPPAELHRTILSLAERD